VGAEVKPVGVVMFPTTHDRTPEFLPQFLATLKNLGRHNPVLIVTKPHRSVVAALCREFEVGQPWSTENPWLLKRYETTLDAELLLGAENRSR